MVSLGLIYRLGFVLSAQRGTGLLAAAARNANRGAKSVRLFELGRRYLADAERPTLAVVLAGERSSRSWQRGKAQPFDAYDVKAEALALLEAAWAGARPQPI